MYGRRLQFKLAAYRTTSLPPQGNEVAYRNVYNSKYPEFVWARVRVVSVWPFVLIQKELWGRGEGEMGEREGRHT